MSDLRQMLTMTYDAINSGDLDAAVEAFDEECETWTPGGPMKGRDAFRAMVQGFRTAAPDNKLTALRIFEDGDTIIVEGVYSGTHTGPLASPAGVIPATGRPFSFPYADILRARDGKFVSHRVYWDNAGFLSQLGLMPEPGP